MITTPYVQKVFMESIAVPLLVNELFESKEMTFDAFLPGDMPGSLSTAHSEIRYFVVVRVFEGTEQKTEIRSKFDFISPVSKYSFAKLYVLSQECTRIGIDSYEEVFLLEMRNKLKDLEEMNALYKKETEKMENFNMQKIKSELNHLENKNNMQLDKENENEEKLSVPEEPKDYYPQQLQISTESPMNTILIRKIALLKSMNMLSKLKTAQYHAKKENKQNILLNIKVPKIEEPQLSKILVCDNKNKLLQIKMPNFVYINEKCKIEITLLRKTKRIKITLKKKEHAEYTDRDTVAFVYERRDLEYVHTLFIYIDKQKHHSFESDLVSISYLLEIRIDDYKSSFPVIYKVKE